MSMSMEEGMVQAKKESWEDDLTLREPTLPNISFEAETPKQAIEAKPYVTMQSQSNAGTAYITSPPNGTDRPTTFLAYNPSMSKGSSPREPTREPAHALAPGYMAKASTDPKESVYPSGAEIPQSSHDNLLHQPKIKNEHSPYPSPVFDQYGEMPSIQDVSDSSPEGASAKEFHTRMRHMRGIFKLTAERPRNIGANSLGQWLRASLWWFLRGKTELDPITRNVHPDWRGEDNLPSNKQCYVDLAKAWWIMQEIIPTIPQSSSTNSSADAADGLDHDELMAVLQRTKWEMSRYFHKLEQRGFLPPPELLVQGADPEIWISYPSFPPALYTLTACLNPRTLVRQSAVNPALAFSMPVTDSESTFSYGRFFGIAHIYGDSTVTRDTMIPCIVSIVRDRAQMLAEFLVTTQDGQINLHIQSDKRIGPSWGAVKWNAKAKSMLVSLMGEVAVEISLREADFRVLFGVHDYNHKLESERLPRADEELLFGDHVRAFHFMGPKDAKTGFPSHPVQDCKVRLFQKTATVTEGSGSRKVFRSYRLSVASPPTVKTLSNMSRQLRENAPILFNNLRGDGGAPALALILDEGGKPASLIFSFESSIKRAGFHTILAGTATSPDECFSEDIPMHSLSIAELANESSPKPTPLPMPQGIQWQRLKIINVGQNLDDAPCIFSDRLRVCMSCNFGSITDRINIGAGELRIGLDTQDTTTIKLYRPAQNSMTIAFFETSVRSKDVAQLSEILGTSAEKPTSRIYKFLSLPVLHDFQALGTGFTVLYDGKATKFAIARRRMVISMHKHLEAEQARIQVLQQDTKVLLVAFFENFSAGRCMCFELRGTDVYEASNHGGKYSVRFVEAKFAMPKPATEVGYDLVCLDVVEYPTEHDDLVFGFDSEDGELSAEAVMYKC
jgi:hypothetical protein